MFTFLFSDKEVKKHLSHYLLEAQGLRPDIGHLLQVCQLFVHCWEVRLFVQYSVRKKKTFFTNTLQF